MKQWYFSALDDFKPEGIQTQFNVRNGNKDYLHIWKVAEVKPGKRISYEWNFGGYPGNSLEAISKMQHHCHSERSEAE